VGIPGVAIIVFTVFIRLLTVPLTIKSMRSTRNMQQIQPLIKEVQKKYGKDRAKQQEETMKIYHEYGVNPAAGCFPALVQIPVFLGLYTALRFTLDHGTNPAMLAPVLFNPAWIPYANFATSFLWVPNLAKPDPFYIFPVMSALFQLIQSRMAMPIRDPNNKPDSQTAMMQNMMQFMPIIILITSINFPAGTVVYWAVSSLFGAVQQYFITGFGSLATLPGFGWLPRKQVVVPAAPPPPPPGGAKSQGLMGRFMAKALDAQKAQQAVQAQTGLTAESRAVDASGTDGASTMRVNNTNKSNGNKKKGSDHQIKTVSTDTMKYASDLKYRSNNHSENGRGLDDISTTASASLPRKRRGKK